MVTVIKSDNFDSYTTGGAPTGYTTPANTTVSTNQARSGTKSIEVANAAATTDLVYNTFDANGGDHELNIWTLFEATSGVTTQLFVRSSLGTSSPNCYACGINIVPGTHVIQLKKRTFNIDANMVGTGANNNVLVTMASNFSAGVWYRQRMRANGPYITFAVQRDSDSFWLTSTGTWQATEVDCIFTYDDSLNGGFVGMRTFTSTNSANRCYYDDLLFQTPNNLIATSWPKESTVYQRDASNVATYFISGFYDTTQPTTPTAIEASVNGGAFATLDAAPSAGAFAGTVTGVGIGYGPVVVRFANNTAITFTVNCGVGDVYCASGQSNMSGRGNASNGVVSVGNTVGQLMKAVLFDNAGYWRKLTDPWDINTNQSIAQSLCAVSDDGTAAAGSIGPMLAAHINIKQRMPVAFVIVAKGGTRIDDGSSSILSWRIPATHNDTTTLYGAMVARCQRTRLFGPNAATGPSIKAVLWWQGESDAQIPVTQSAYQTSLLALTAAIMADIGCKTMAMKLQDTFTGITVGGSTGATQANRDAINNAIGYCWANDANSIPGADFSDITCVEDTQGLHIKTDIKQGLCAYRVYNALATAFYPATGASKLINGGFIS